MMAYDRGMRRLTRTIATGAIASALTLGIWTLGGGVSAQSERPIYLQYDGFVRNKDGSFTLSFGYFNTNLADVTIPAGSANLFTPGAGDRNQPVRFLKGRHRFACSMVVDNKFDGKLQWKVTFAGRTEVTTTTALDPLYELDANNEKRALTGLDVATAPKNSCVNRAPMLSILSASGEVSAAAATVVAEVGQDAAINGDVEDDALPRGSVVTSEWKKASGPGTVTFSSAATGPTRVSFSAPGAYVLDLSASDGDKTSTLKVPVTVSPAPPPAEAPPDTYVKTMKDVAAAQAALRGHTTAKEYDNIAKDAASFGTLFGQTSAFWQPRNVADAIAFASAGSKASEELGLAAKNKNDEAIATATRSIGATCQGCHTAHRLRLPDGGYAIK
jgi:hypothetical protein